MVRHISTDQFLVVVYHVLVGDPILPFQLELVMDMQGLLDQLMNRMPFSNSPYDVICLPDAVTSNLFATFAYALSLYPDARYFGFSQISTEESAGTTKSYARYD